MKNEVQNRIDNTKSIREIDIELTKKLVSLLQGLGWDVKPSYSIKQGPYRTYRTDIALFNADKMVGAVEVYGYDTSVDLTRFLSRKQPLFDSMILATGIEYYYIAVADKIFRYKNYTFEETDFIAPSSVPPKDYVSDKEQIRLLLKQLSEQKAHISRLEEEVGKLSDQIAALKSSASKQLSVSGSEDEQDKIIADFSNTVSNTITEGLNAASGFDYEKEEKELKTIFENTWDKLDEASKRCLVSGRYMYQFQSEFADIFDYSGVCILITKSVEIELKKRFFDMYIKYLATVKKLDQFDFPNNLLDQNRSLMLNNEFSLGSIPFLLQGKKVCKGAAKLNHWDYENNKKTVVDYCKAELMASYSEQDISRYFVTLSNSVRDIIDKYRNPSAHSNPIRLKTAQDCMNCIIDVEQFLKNTLDKFSK